MELSSMDRAVSKATLLKRKIKATLVIVIATLTLVAVQFGFRQFITPYLVEGKFETSIVQYGSMSETISCTGKIELDNHFIILSPASTVLEKIITSPGQVVKEGDTLLILDEAPIQKEVEAMILELKSLENDQLKNRLNTEKEKIELEFDLKKIQIDIAQKKTLLLDQENLLTVGGTSTAKVNEARQALELAKHEYEVAKKKSKIRTDELRVLSIDTDLAYRKKQIELKVKQNQLERMLVKAPSSGVVISVSTETGNIVDENTELVKISDLHTFKITGEIPDSFADKVSSGGQVEIIIDKENQLDGSIGNIRPLVDNGKIYFDIFPEDKSHPRFRPNLDVELRILTTYKARTLRLKDGPYFDGAKKFNVYKVQNDVAVATEVKTGIKNFDYVEILSGLNEGDEVVISDVSSFNHLSEVEIRNAKK